MKQSRECSAVHQTQSISESSIVFSRDCPNAILVYLCSYQELWWTFVDKNFNLHQVNGFFFRHQTMAAARKKAPTKGTTNKETQNQ